MMKPVVASLALLPLLATLAHAEGEVTTTTANTVVVVTPNAPVMVSGNQQQSIAPVVQPAFAPPGSQEMPPAGPPPAPPAPQNEEWGNVSHINGQVVPVGERGAYLYKFRKNNLSADPFGFFAGYYDVAGSHALSQNVAVTVSATLWSLKGGESGYALSASVPIFFKRTFSGPYLEPGLVTRTTTNGYGASCNGCSTGSYSNSDTWAGPELLLGWQWTFDSGLNLAAAAGVAKHMSGQMDTYGDNNDAVGYFRAGYAF